MMYTTGGGEYALAGVKYQTSEKKWETNFKNNGNERLLLSPLITLEKDHGKVWAIDHQA